MLLSVRDIQHMFSTPASQYDNDFSKPWEKFPVKTKLKWFPVFRKRSYSQLDFSTTQSVVKSFIPLLGRRRILFLKCNLWLKQFRCEKTRFFPMLEWQHHHFHHRRSRCRYHHKKDMWSTTKKGALLCQLSPWTTYIVHSWGEIWLTPYRGVQFFQISLIIYYPNNDKISLVSLKNVSSE